MPAFSKLCVAALAAGITTVHADLSGNPDGGGYWSPEMDKYVKTAFDNAMPTIAAPTINPKDAAAAMSAYKIYEASMSAKLKASTAKPNSPSSSKPTATAKPSSSSSAKTTSKTTLKIISSSNSAPTAKPSPTTQPPNTVIPAYLLAPLTSAIASGDASDIQRKLSTLLPLLKTALPADVLEARIKDLVAKIPSSLPKTAIEQNVGKLVNVLLSNLAKEELEKELDKLKVVLAAAGKTKSLVVARRDTSVAAVGVKPMVRMLGAVVVVGTLAAGFVL
jgi:hypothetical protein